MNPNSYGVPINQQHLHQSQQPTHQYPTTWPPAQQEQTPVEPNRAPPTLSSVANMQPTSSQEMVNGNYQQQLASSMSGLSVNPTKQCLNMSVPQHQGVAVSNGPPSKNSQMGENFVGPPPSNSNSINSLEPESYGEEQLPVFAPPPVQNQTMAEQVKEQQKQSKDGIPILSPPPSLGQNLLPPSLPGASPQSIQLGANQMNTKSANVQGHPHVPPAKTTTSPFISPSGHSATHANQSHWGPQHWA